MVKNIFFHELEGFYPIKKFIYLLSVILLLGFGLLSFLILITDTPDTIDMIIVSFIISIISLVCGITALKPMFLYITEPFHVVPVIAHYISPKSINELLKKETFIYNDDYEDYESYHFLSFSKNWMYVNGYFIPYNVVATMALTYERRRYYRIHYLFITFINGKSIRIKLREMAKYIGQSEPYFFTDDSFLEYFIKQVTRNTGIIGINLNVPYSLKEYNKLMEPVVSHLSADTITIEDINHPYPYRDRIEVLLKSNLKKGESYILDWSKYSNRTDKPSQLLSDSILFSDGSTKAYDLCNAKELYDICNKLNVSIDSNKEKDAKFMLKRIYATYENNQVQYKKTKKKDYVWIIFIVILSVIAFFLPIILEIM